MTKFSLKKKAYRDDKPLYGKYICWLAHDCFRKGFHHQVCTLLFIIWFKDKNQNLIDKGLPIKILKVRLM